MWNRSKNHKLQAVTLLSSLLRTQEDAVTLNTRLKLSAYERDLTFFLVAHRDPKLSSNPLSPLLPYKQLVVKSKSKVSNVVEWILEVLKYNNSPLIEDFLKWEMPKFPISGATLKENGIESGKMMGFVLNELKQIWADSDFTLTQEELVNHIPKFTQKFEEKRTKK